MRAVRKPVLFYIFILFLVLSIGTYSRLQAQDKVAVPIIHLKNTNLQLPANATQWLDSFTKAASSEPIRVLMQFSSLPTAEQKAQLKAAGVKLLDYIPGNAYQALITNAAAQNTKALTLNLQSIITVQPEWKTSNYLLQQINVNAHNTIEVLIAFESDIDKKTIQAYLKQYGGSIVAGNMEAYGVYKIAISGDKLMTAMQWYGIKYVSPVSKNLPLDRIAKDNAKINLVAQPLSLGGFNLLGDGMTIGIGDDCSGIYHVDLRDRVINYNPAAMTHHGEHINGIAGGAGIIDPLAEGISWHATFVNHYYDNILFYTGVMHDDHNMTITNNSYVVAEGDCSYEGTYDIYSNFLDSLALRYNDVLHVFAAGNDGQLTCTPYAAGYGTTCGGYQPSKNGLAVTNIDEQFNIAYDGSQGPVKDGRVKPDMCAIGTNVYSDIDVTSYEFASGSSMASPQVAGAAGLLAERYKQLNGGVNAPVNIMKALLINGAMDIGNPGPDYRYGFGALDLYRSLQMLNNHQYATNSIANGGAQSFNITVPANTAQLKVMLYWADAPASPMAAAALVNDLDLTVQVPSANIHKPLILDPTPANITNNATEGADHLNNVEQVTVNNPTSGSYTINVSGYNVPSGTQAYVVAYDFIPLGLQLTYPATAAKVSATDSMHVYWDASIDSNTFTLQYSTSNGASWQQIANNIPAGQRYYTWMPSSISSGQCQMRISRNNTSQVVTSGTFIIAPQIALSLDSVQCPGYVNVHWPAVTNASAYQVHRKVGPYMQPMDTVSTTNYQLAGLSTDSTYYVSVAPIINGLAGYRSIAVYRQPVDGTCATPYSNGDLTISQIIAPQSGRKFTSTQLSNNETLSLQVRDLYTTACNSYTVSYSINNAAWQSATSLPVIPATGTAIVNISGIDLSATGSYLIKAAINNLSLTDHVPQNDTITETIVNIDNAPIDLTTTFTDGFESLPDTTLLFANIGLAAASRWDYSHSTDSGRLRTYVDDSLAITGSRSISMDAWLAMPGNQNYLDGTFNFSTYNTSSEIRCEFDYLLSGQPKFAAGNQVLVRGNDTQPWVNLYNYSLNSVGSVVHSGTLSLTDAMLHNSQAYSSSFQIRFGQNDTSLIASRDYGNGVTIDNVKFYTVQDDMQLVSIVSPVDQDCGLGANAPLTVMVHNGVNNVQNNVQLFYSLDSGAVVSGLLPTIAAKDSVLFTFTQTLNLAAGAHTLSVWLVASGDTYRANDSILHHTFHNQPLVAAYPYLENFESSNGNWYTDGTNDSWQYGTPASPKINKAASGTKAWKTNLTGNYNNLETSYLYSPCFDLSALTSPMLSFSMTVDIENCGSTLCDGAWIEYSHDGSTWTKLGAGGQGTNWYDTSFQLWHDQGNPRWHVASIPLPTGGTQPVRLRFVFSSDQGANFEGLAIDDIHIFDRQYDIYSGAASGTVQQSMSAGTLSDVLLNSQLIAQLQPQSDLGSTATSIYLHDSLTNPDRTQYIIPRSLVIKTNNAPTDSVLLRLYVLDTEVVKVLNDTTCISCTKPSDAYRLGITKYTNPTDPALENGSLADNTDQVYNFYPYSAITWVPYDQGYYAELKVKSFSEFWFNNGGPTGNLNAVTDYVTFNANKINAQNVAVSWSSIIDTGINTYWLQRSYDGNMFTDIDQQQSLHTASAAYNYTDTPAVNIGSSVYYRLRWVMNNDSTYYSPTRIVDWTDVDEFISYYPNPTQGLFYIKWSANVGEQLQVAITDITGKECYRNSFTATGWNNITAIHTLHFPTGMYFLRVVLAGKKHDRKLLYY